MTPQPKPGRVSICDKWRRKTDFKKLRPSGYAPMFFAVVPEVGRLTTGKATQLVYVVLTASLGQFTDKEKGQGFNETAADITTAELAELCYCDVKTIQRELADLKRRKVIEWEQTKKGVNTITPLFRHWAGLPDYKPAPVAEPDPEPEDEPVEEDPAQPATKRTVNVTSAPVYVRAGKQSKRYGVDGAVTHTQFLVRGNLDAECSAVLKDGVLQVILEGKWDGKKLGGSVRQTKGIEEKPRHSRGISPSVHPPSEKRKSGERQSLHPRAAELSTLFDAPIYRSCKKTLSGDPVALKKACQAIGECPHEYLIEFLEGRAERKILPMHVPAICLEALHNWQKSKDLPESERMPTREEIDALVEQERKELAAKRAALKRGRVA